MDYSIIIIMNHHNRQGEQYHLSHYAEMPSYMPIYIRHVDM